MASDTAVGRNGPDSGARGEDGGKDRTMPLAAKRSALLRIIGTDSHIDASIRSSGPVRVVVHGNSAKAACATLAALEDEPK